MDSLVKDIISPIVALTSGKALEENFVVLRKDVTFANPDVRNFPSLLHNKWTRGGGGFGGAKKKKRLNHCLSPNLYYH